jgi:hypothetical protein
MRKVIKLKESELRNLIKGMINEQIVGTTSAELGSSDQEKKTEAGQYLASKDANGLITAEGPYKGKKWSEYVADKGLDTNQINNAKQVAQGILKNIQDKKNQEANQIQRYRNIVAMYNSVDDDGIIRRPGSWWDGKLWSTYRSNSKEGNNISDEELQKAKDYVEQNPQTAAAPAAKVAPKQVKPKAVKQVPSELTVSIQKILKDNKYDLGQTGQNKDGIDGIWGAKTDMAWNQYISKSKNNA